MALVGAAATYLATVLNGRTLFPTASMSSLWHSLAFRPAVRLFWYIHAVLVESHPFFTTLDLQLSFYRTLCYNSRAHCPLLQHLHTTSAKLDGAHSYFVVSFKCEGKNSCHDLIPTLVSTIVIKEILKMLVAYCQGENWLFHGLWQCKYNLFKWRNIGHFVDWS